MATRTGKSFTFEPSGKNVSKINYSWTTEPFVILIYHLTGASKVGYIE
jgi:hypothetical protein